jgi:leader peptidase (prepilin peptidase)/N-methyltransferase
MKIAIEHVRIEILGGLMGALAQFVAPGWEGFTGGCLGSLLLALIVLDYRYFWLPDRLTALVAVGGLTTGALGYHPSLPDRLLGGVAGYAILALIAWSFAKLRHRKGMGAGDPKLLGAIGLWLGWKSLPFVLLGACVLAVPLLIIQLAQKRSINAQTRLPLGALMAAAAFPLWLAGH